MTSAAEVEIFRGVSLLDQEPTGTGIENAVIVTYGAGGLSTDGCMSIGSDGVIDILGLCDPRNFKFTFRVGRTGPSGVADIAIWSEVSLDGINFFQPAIEDTVVFRIDTANQVVTFRISGDGSGNLPVGTKIRLMLARDAGGSDSGGLYSQVLTGTLSGINPAASAILEIYEREVI